MSLLLIAPLIALAACMLTSPLVARWVARFCCLGAFGVTLVIWGETSAQTVLPMVGWQLHWNSLPFTELTLALTPLALPFILVAQLASAAALWVEPDKGKTAPTAWVCAVLFFWTTALAAQDTLSWVGSVEALCLCAMALAYATGSWVPRTGWAIAILVHGVAAALWTTGAVVLALEHQSQLGNLSTQWAALRDLTQNTGHAGGFDALTLAFVCWGLGVLLRSGIAPLHGWHTSILTCGPLAARTLWTALPLSLMVYSLAKWVMPILPAQWVEMAPLGLVFFTLSALYSTALLMFAPTAREWSAALPAVYAAMAAGTLCLLGVLGATAALWLGTVGALCAVGCVQGVFNRPQKWPTRLIASAHFFASTGLPGTALFVAIALALTQGLKVSVPITASWFLLLGCMFAGALTSLRSLWNSPPELGQKTKTPAPIAWTAWTMALFLFVFYSAAGLSPQVLNSMVEPSLKNLTQSRMLISLSGVAP